MRRAALLLVVLVLASGVTGCSSTGYLANRIRDLGDVVNASVGIGGGAKCRAGPLHIGLLINVDELGIRNGVAFTPGWTWWPGGMEVDSFLIPMARDELPGYFPVIFGMEGFCARTSDRANPVGEAGAVSPLPFVSLPVPTEKDAPLPPGMRAKYLTQVEVVGGLVVTLRLGLNVGEIVDFVLGWASVDIFGDDLRDGQEAEAEPSVPADRRQASRRASGGPR